MCTNAVHAALTAATPLKLGWLCYPMLLPESRTRVLSAPRCADRGLCCSPISCLDAGVQHAWIGRKIVRQQVHDAAALTKTRVIQFKAPADLITNRTRLAYGFIGPASKHIVLGILEALAGLPLPTSGETP